MTTEEKRGRKLLVIIALVVGGPNLLNALRTLLSDAQTGGIVTWFYSLFPVVLPWLLYKGYRWARGYLVLSLALGGPLLMIGAILQLVLGAPLFAGATGVGIAFVLGLLNLVAGIVLFRSKAVEAYVDRQTQSRSGVISVVR